MSDQANTTTIEGVVAPGFEPVREAFERNFTEHGEKGASVSVCVDGETVVDLWGGVANVTTGSPWTKDTITLVYSATKGATAILVNLLAQQGRIDLDAPVSSYWPEYGCEGKEATTVRMVLSHQAGLPVIGETLTQDQLIAGEPVVSVLAAQAPEWVPGTDHGYHALTFGWLVGEIVRRAIGQSVGEVFATEIAGPLGLDFFIGLPTSELSRVAPLVNAEPPDMSVLDSIEDPDTKAFIMQMVGTMMDPSSLINRALSSNGSLPTPDADTWNDPRIYAMEQPAANGITNARSLARLYAACVSDVDGTRLLSEPTVAAATIEQSSGPDKVVMSPSSFGTGFMLLSPMAPLLSASSFGHVGAGGALGFADRDARLGFGYAQNQLGGGLMGEPRTEGLLAALRSVL